MNTESIESEKRIYFPELDGLRFLAFLLVFFHHRDWFPVPAFSFIHEIGWIGVDLFFALSAFLFTKLLIAEYKKTETISIKKFYIRRIFRIWPVYFLMIGISLLYYISIDGQTLATIEPKRLWGLFTFTDNIVTAFNGYTPLPFINPLWTISYEEQFYIFIPLLILFLVKVNTVKKIIFLVSAYLLFTGFKLTLIYFQTPHPAIWVLPISHFESILFGIVIGFNGFDFLTKRVKPFLILALSFFFLYLYTKSTPLNATSPGLILTYLFIGLSTSFVLLAVIKSSYLKVVLSHPILVFLGKRSYGLYVFHQMANTTLGDYVLGNLKIIPHTPIATLLCSLIITIVLAIFSYFLLEKPFLILKKKFEVIRSRPI